jgi:hypothetical protein
VSSRLDPETGVVTISAPCYSWAEVGRRLFVVGSEADRRFGYGCNWPDWVERLLTPRPQAGRAWNVGPDPRIADQALLEALRTRQVHPSLVEEPRVAA